MLYLLVDKQRSLPVPGVTPVVSAADLDGFIVEVVRHLGLGVAVHEPEQVDVVSLHAVLRVVFLAEELGGLGVTVVRGTLDVKVLQKETKLRFQAHDVGIGNHSFPVWERLTSSELMKFIQ